MIFLKKYWQWIISTIIGIIGIVLTLLNNISENKSINMPINANNINGNITGIDTNTSGLKEILSDKSLNMSINSLNSSGNITGIKVNTDEMEFKVNKPINIKSDGMELKINPNFGGDIIINKQNN